MLLVRQDGIALQVAEDFALPGTPKRKSIESVQPEILHVQSADFRQFLLKADTVHSFLAKRKIAMVESP